MSRILITAGATGIGRAMAEAFAPEGHEVWVTDIDADALETCPKAWKTRQVNAADENAVAALFEEMGTIDVLCANAGIAGPTARIEDIKIEDWWACLSVNLDGAFLAAKYAAPRMKDARKGVILLTSSTAGMYGFPNRAPYAAAKWGVIGLMKTLAMELGPYGIRANAICPGAVEGPRMTGVMEREAKAKGMSYAEVYKGYATGTSLGRLIEAQDIAEMAVFLASDAARMVSGQVIAVDGHTVNPDPQI